MLRIELEEPYSYADAAHDTDTVQSTMSLLWDQNLVDLIQVEHFVVRARPAREPQDRHAVCGRQRDGEVYDERLCKLRGIRKLINTSGLRRLRLLRG
jgi:hypothetical protein